MSKTTTDEILEALACLHAAEARLLAYESRDNQLDVLDAQHMLRRAQVRARLGR